MNLHVGNISARTSEMELRKIFEKYGTVGKISVNKKITNPQGYNFCFVEMPDDRQASQAIEQLHGKSQDDYILSVMESGVSA